MAAMQATGEFKPFTEPGVLNDDKPCTDAFHNVSFMPEHLSFSAEELRLNDYSHGRRFVSAPGTELSSYGLVRLLRGDDAGSQGSSCRASARHSMQLGSETITLRAGNEGFVKDFIVHRDLITRRSPFVRLALGGDWKEAKSGIITLPEDSADTVGVYQQWLYTGCIISINPSPECAPLILPVEA